jgi:hypothetical protein
MAEIKTKLTTVSPASFIKTITDAQQRKDSTELVAMMKSITGKPAKMWGPSIIGFDQYHYKYDSGHEGDMCLTGFSPRKGTLALYIGHALEEARLLEKLGKYKTGKSCLYIKKLDDIDRGVLRDLIRVSVDEMRRRYSPH